MLLQREIMVRHESRDSNVDVKMVMSNAFNVNKRAKQPFCHAGVQLQVLIQCM